MSVSVLLVFLTGPWVGLQLLIVVFPDTHFIFPSKYVHRTNASQVLAITSEKVKGHWVWIAGQGLHLQFVLK